MGAGEYITRLRWLKPTTEVDETGDGVDTFSPVGYLWCSVDETNGRRTDEAGAVQTGVDVEIRIRNYPTVQTTDLLQDTFYGYTYHIDTIRNASNELVVQGYRDDTLINFSIDEEP